MPSPHTGKREIGKQERRDRLCEAAGELFREQGYQKTTVDQITRRAGLAKGTFFNYFPTKDTVLRHLGARTIGRLSAGGLAGGSTSAIDSLKRFMTALATSIERDRELVKLIFTEGISVPELLCEDAGGFSLRPTATLLIRRAQHQREINPILDPDTLAIALDALYLQQLVRWCRAESLYPLAERFTGIVDLLMMGIAAR